MGHCNVDRKIPKREWWNNVDKATVKRKEAAGKNEIMKERCIKLYKEKNRVRKFIYHGEMLERNLRDT